MPYLLQVVMLATYPQALLAIGHSAIFDRYIPQYDILKLIHTSISKHKCGIILDHHRCRWHHLMPFTLKELQILPPYFINCHHIKSNIRSNDQIFNSQRYQILSSYSLQKRAIGTSFEIRSPQNHVLPALKVLLYH
ncbi:Uncharacterised protein [Chlamydia trachomatis]|nr:Uncharacterised protein [Chlamydia trachomatis]